MTCKCGKLMIYLVGNSGVKAWWCECGRAAMTNDGEPFKWHEPKKESSDA